MYNRINNKMHKKNKVISQINVTPFVDVMLVLLIVFMITAPLLTVGVSVDLPKTKASQLNSKGDPIIISIKKNGPLFIQEREIDTEMNISQVLKDTQERRKMTLRPVLVSLKGSLTGGTENNAETRVWGFLKEATCHIQ